MGITTQILVHPAHNNNRTGRAWERCQREVLKLLAPAEVVIAETTDAAENLAKEAAMKGIRRFITVGGQNLETGVINGLMTLAPAHRQTIQMGQLSLSGHNDLGKTLKLPTGFEKQLEILSAGHTIPIDLGRVEWIGKDGIPQSRYFINGAGFVPGRNLSRLFSAQKKQLAKDPTQLGNSIRRSWHQLIPLVRLQVGETTLFEGRAPSVLVMGGCYYRRMGLVAPKANPHDHALDVVWLPATQGWNRALRFLRFLIPGSRPFTGGVSARVEALRVTCEEMAVQIEADGQLIGRLPATFSLEPKALEVIVPQVGARVKKPVFKKLPKGSEGELVGVPRVINLHRDLDQEMADDTALTTTR